MKAKNTQTQIGQELNPQDLQAILLETFGDWEIANVFRGEFDVIARNFAPQYTFSNAESNDVYFYVVYGKKMTFVEVWICNRNTKVAKRLK